MILSRKSLILLSFSTFILFIILIATLCVIFTKDDYKKTLTTYQRSALNADLIIIGTLMSVNDTYPPSAIINIEDLLKGKTPTEQLSFHMTYQGQFSVGERVVLFLKKYEDRQQRLTYYAQRHDSDFASLDRNSDTNRFIIKSNQRATTVSNITLPNKQLALDEFIFSIGKIGLALPYFQWLFDRVFY